MLYAILNEDCSMIQMHLQMNFLANCAHFRLFLEWFILSIFISLCLFSIIHFIHCLNLVLSEQIFHFNCTIPSTCCISAWPTSKDDFRSDWVHSKKWQPAIPALLCSQCVHLVIGEKTGPLLSHHQLTHKNMTLSGVITPCQVFIRRAGRARLALADSFLVLMGISTGSRCHCRTNGVISTAIRLILFKLKKKMVILMLGSLLLDNHQPDVGSVCSHYIKWAVASQCITSLFIISGH